MKHFQDDTQIEKGRFSFRTPLINNRGTRADISFMSGRGIVITFMWIEHMHGSETIELSTMTTIVLLPAKRRNQRDITAVATIIDTEIEALAQIFSDEGPGARAKLTERLKEILLATIAA